MAKFIKTIVDRINLANRKGLCPFYTPEQICDEVHAESMNIWLKYTPLHEKDAEIEKHLRPLRSSEQIIPDVNGIGVFVNNTAYITGIRTFAGKPVDRLTDDQFYRNLDDSIRVHTVDFPVVVIRLATVFVSPSTTVFVNLIKKPTKPVYAFNPSGEDYIYDDTNSVDFEWDEILHDQIMNRVLRNLGIADQRHDIVNYSQQEQTIEGK